MGAGTSMSWLTLRHTGGQDKMGIDLGQKNTATYSDGTQLEAGRIREWTCSECGTQPRTQQAFVVKSSPVEGILVL